MSAPRPLPRLHHADALRASAVLGVIVIHAANWQRPLTWSGRSLFPAVELLARASVPIFMLLSGLLLARRDAPVTWPWLRRRLRRSLTPWAFWVVVFIVFGIAVSRAVAPSPTGVWSWVLGGSGHLYYLLLAPQLFLLAAVWRPRSRRATWCAVLVALILQLSIDVWRLNLPLPGGWPGALIRDHAFQLLPGWLGFAAIGYAMGQRREHGLPPAWLLAALFIASGWALLHWGVIGSPRPQLENGYGAYLTPLLLPFTLSLALVVVRASHAVTRWAPLRRLIAVTARHSLGIYVVHPIFIFLVGRWAEPLLGSHSDWGSVASLTAMVLGAYAGGLAATLLIGATPLAWCVGESKPEARAPERELHAPGRRPQLAS